MVPNVARNKSNWTYLAWQRTERKSLNSCGRCPTRRYSKSRRTPRSTSYSWEPFWVLPQPCPALKSPERYRYSPAAWWFCWPWKTTVNAIWTYRSTRTSIWAKFSIWWSRTDRYRSDSRLATYLVLDTYKLEMEEVSATDHNVTNFNEKFSIENTSLKERAHTNSIHGVFFRSSESPWFVLLNRWERGTCSYVWEEPLLWTRESKSILGKFGHRFTFWDIFKCLNWFERATGVVRDPSGKVTQLTQFVDLSRVCYIVHKVKHTHNLPDKYTPDVNNFSGKSVIDLGATMSWCSRSSVGRERERERKIVWKCRYTLVDGC